jgi:hypothetical protein
VPVWTAWRKFLTLLGLDLRPLGRPARSQSLYRLSYPGLVLRRIFGWKRDEVTGGWRKLHNEELRNLYSSLNIVTCRGDYRRGFDWILDLLTTYTTRNYKQLQRHCYFHNSQITTAPAKPFPACLSSPAVPWQGLLIVEILQLHALKSSLHSLPC